MNVLLGSPPHTRGIPNPLIDTTTPLGITPAHAGNTAPTVRFSFPAGDHPRTRGEYEDFNAMAIGNQGSPPHTRGIQKQGYFRVFLCRITPAHAGNTAHDVRFFQSQWDHPRTRGEYSGMIFSARLVLGSPPHTRGILLGKGGGTQTYGITPAHAGNTIFQLFDQLDKRDHPRTRGEYLRSGEGTPFKKGSPPHTRGIRRVGKVFLCEDGITPAHAGNTFPRSIRKSV